MSVPSNTVSLQVLNIEVPAMYADHHVVEVRRILNEIPGVEDVYASSSFKVVEISYDSQKTNPEALRARLAEAGYLGDLFVPVELGAVREDGEKPFFRHTAVYEQTRQAVSFGQVVGYQGRPLWPCPGMGVVHKKMDE